MRSFALTRKERAMFHGAITAIITPFADNRVDEQRLRDNVEFQISHGIQGLVPCGTTGESPTLSHDEHDRVIEIVVQAAAGRVPVIAGAGSNSTAEALRLTRHARQTGADATLHVTGYYNKPTQEGMYRHFMSIADAVDLPIVLYNIPGRCVVGLCPETIARLAAHPNIVAVKEATGSVESASAIADLCEITIISGDDAMTLPLAAVGARGVISVLANILPERIRALTDAIDAANLDAARQLHHELFPLAKGMLSLSTNPIPIKAAMKLIGTDTGQVRLPLCPMPDPLVDQLQTMLRNHNLLP
jgi:4-hydroxy-tetrahydrodipicolinate synthase